MNEQQAVIEKVAQAFANLGANAVQSKTMAKQLVKRAEQLSKEKNTLLMEELGHLLATVSCGAQGQLKPEDNRDNP
jgi:methyl-accepting chemotaxis protein